MRTILDVAEGRRKAGRTLSIEGYLLINFCMDSLLLLLALRAVGLPVTLRIMAGGAIGAGYAAATAFCPQQWLRALPMQGAVMLVMLLVSSGLQGAKPRVIAAAAMQALFLGGVLEFTQVREAGLTAFCAALALGCCLLYLAQDRRRMSLNGLMVQVCIREGDCSARFTALIDTGNRLREPFSGLPVLIVEERLLAKLPVRGEHPMRRIPYGGLGGSGFLEAFRPQQVTFFDGARVRPAPEIWVALYPGRMAGSVRALAPPVFALSQKENSERIREERLEI